MDRQTSGRPDGHILKKNSGWEWALSGPEAPPSCDAWSVPARWLWQQRGATPILTGHSEAYTAARELTLATMCRIRKEGAHNCSPLAHEVVIHEMRSALSLGWPMLPSKKLWNYKREDCFSAERGVDGIPTCRPSACGVTASTRWWNWEWLHTCFVRSISMAVWTTIWPIPQTKSSRPSWEWCWSRWSSSRDDALQLEKSFSHRHRWQIRSNLSRLA